MGEIAEMMLDGTLCAGCGEFLDGESPRGYPGYCSKTCAPDDFVCDTPTPRRSPAARKAARINAARQVAAGRVLPCPECGKRFRKEIGVRYHRRDKHGVPLPSCETSL